MSIIKKALRHYSLIKNQILCSRHGLTSIYKTGSHPIPCLKYNSTLDAQNLKRFLILIGYFKNEVAL